jgi:hypothetical protein
MEMTSRRLKKKHMPITFLAACGVTWGNSSSVFQLGFSRSARLNAKVRGSGVGLFRAHAVEWCE